MSRTNPAAAPLFQVGNHHSAASGTPPPIADLCPSHYLGYFENTSGEQVIFVYDRNSRHAVLYLGWATPAGRPHTRWSMAPCPICSYRRRSWCGYTPAGRQPLLHTRR